MNPTNSNKLPTDEWEFEGEDQLAPAASTLSDNEKVSIEKAQYSVYELLRHIKRERIILAPTFQRNDVWKKVQKSELVESILLGIPLPLIYLFEDENGVRQVIDGKQRISALKAFLNNEFKLTGLKVLADINGTSFEALAGMQQSMLEDHQLMAYVLKPPTPERIKFDIYDRVNRGGTQLNKQEIRFALYQGQSTELLQQIAQTEAFQQATGKAISNKRMRDQYAILRSCAFYLSHPNIENEMSLSYQGDIEQLLTNTMKSINQGSPQDLRRLSRRIRNAYRQLFNSLGENAFRFASETERKRPINIGLLETLIFVAQEVDFTQSSLSSRRISDLLRKFRKQLDESELCGQNQTSLAAYRQRQQLAQQLVIEIKESENA